MLDRSKQHLRESHTSYFEHFKFACYASALLFYSSVASLIHAFIPALFRGTSAFVVIKLYKERLENHPNKLYQEWINDVNNNQRRSK